MANLERSYEAVRNIRATGRSDAGIVTVTREANGEIDVWIRRGTVRQLADDEIASEIRSALLAAVADHRRQFIEVRVKYSARRCSSNRSHRPSRCPRDPRSGNGRARSARRNPGPGRCAGGCLAGAGCAGLPVIGGERRQQELGSCLVAVDQQTLGTPVITRPFSYVWRRRSGTGTATRGGRAQEPLMIALPARYAVRC